MEDRRVQLISGFQGKKRRRRAISCRISLNRLILQQDGSIRIKVTELIVIKMF